MIKIIYVHALLPRNSAKLQAWLTLLLDLILICLRARASLSLSFLFVFLSFSGEVLLLRAKRYVGAFWRGHGADRPTSNCDAILEYEYNGPRFAKVYVLTWLHFYISPLTYSYRYYEMVQISREDLRSGGKRKDRNAVLNLLLRPSELIDQTYKNRLLSGMKYVCVRARLWAHARTWTRDRKDSRACSRWGRSEKEAILVGVLMLLQGSVTSVIHIWPGNDMSKEKDFARIYLAKACPRARESFRLLSSFWM